MVMHFFHYLCIRFKTEITAKLYNSFFDEVLDIKEYEPLIIKEDVMAISVERSVVIGYLVMMSETHPGDVTDGVMWWMFQKAAFNSLLLKFVIMNSPFKLTCF